MEREQTTIRLPVELKEKLLQEADKNGISFNAMMIKCSICGKAFEPEKEQKGQINIKCPECKKKIASKLAGKEAK